MSNIEPNFESSLGRVSNVLNNRLPLLVHVGDFRTVVTCWVFAWHRWPYTYIIYELNTYVFFSLYEGLFNIVKQRWALKSVIKIMIIIIMTLEHHWIVRNHNSTSALVRATNMIDTWQSDTSEPCRVTERCCQWKWIRSDRSHHSNGRRIQYACRCRTCRHDPYTVFRSRPESRLTESIKIATSGATLWQDQTCSMFFFFIRSTIASQQLKQKKITRLAPTPQTPVNHRHCHKVQ